MVDDAKNGIQQLRNFASQKGGLTEAHGSINSTLTKAEVEAYVAQRFVKKALKTPSKVYSVLSFFFVSSMFCFAKSCVSEHSICFIHQVLSDTSFASGSRL